MRKSPWISALALLITLIGSTSAAPTVILDDSHLVVFKIPQPNDQTAERGAGENPGYRLPPGEDSGAYADYKYPACAYWVPYFSLLSYEDSEGRVHVFPAITRGSGVEVFGIADNVINHLSSSIRVEVNLTSNPPSSLLDLYRKLGYHHLVLIVSEYDPMAISSALALKWKVVNELCRRSPGVRPEDVGVVIVFMARATVVSRTETKDVLIPLIPGACVINPINPFTWRGVEEDPFYQLYLDSDLIVVVYETEAFRNEAELVFGDKAIYVKASPDIIAGAPAVIFNVPRRESWRRARIFEPWPSSLYLGALYGLPIAWAAEDLRFTGYNWEGVIIVTPPAEGSMYWDITSLLTEVLPTILEANPHVFISYMSLTDPWNHSIQVGTFGFHGALPCLGCYPWDLSGVNLTTSTLLFSCRNLLIITYDRIPEGENTELGWGVVGPYEVVFEGPRDTPLILTWYALTTGFCEWAYNMYRGFGRIPDQLRDAEVVTVGLEGLFALAKGLILGGINQVARDRDYRFVLFFGYPVLRWRTSDRIEFDVNAPNRHYTVIMGRGGGPVPDVPFVLAQSGDVYTILTLEPFRTDTGPDVNPSTTVGRRVKVPWAVWAPVPLPRSRRSSR
ncbi:hypothetical protein [Methanopyrus sp.]